MPPQDPSRFLEPKRITPKETDYRIALENYIPQSMGSWVEKMQNFTKYIPTQDLRKFVTRYEIFKKILHLQGSVVECGVQFGNGLMTWAQLSEIFEPLNHTRNIIGFDTFAGFPSLSEKDKTPLSVQSKQGGLAVDSYDDIMQGIEIFDCNRFIPHIPKIRLLRGDVKDTLPRYLQEHPYTVVSLLHLDFDTYEPTLIALKHLVPRMPKGAVIAFDELNHEVWPGETIAVMEELGIRNLRTERFTFGSTLSYAVLE